MLKTKFMATRVCVLCKRSNCFESAKYLLGSTNLRYENFKWSKTSSRFQSTLNKSAALVPGEAVSNTVELLSNTDVITHTADAFGTQAFPVLKTAGLVQDGLIYATESLGVSWPVALAIAAVSMRTVLLPATIYLKKLAIKRSNLSPQRFQVQKALMEDLKTRALSGEKVTAADQFRISQRMMQWDERNGLSMVKMLWPMWLQLPVILSMFMGIRDLSERKFISLAAADFIWIPDLCMSDPLFLLPAINFATVLLVLRLGVDGPTNDLMKSKKFAIGSVVCLPIVTFFMNSCFPSALILYWFSSNCIGLLINKALGVDFVRQAVKIPKRVIHPEDFNEFEMTKKLTRELTDIMTRNLKQEQYATFDTQMRERHKKLQELKYSPKTQEMKKMK